ncbi:PIF1-like helicase-domain-containing protein [Suillus paluster]|uniref:PIF1-like helicase-domain-containing protein n=1 Tax=Suillus paluster TaxID=48578 RepID=UPI001B862BD4|nr:PIF1-like helicase-domain-containing protein [Suillus paluster]KAG1749646.1 PIF1-like helicase-domain-containing protein [Suillus paluster]
MPAYYAVRIGREGPKIYSNFRDFQKATLGLSGSSGKGFDTLEEAEAWLTDVPTSGVSVTRTTTTVTWDVSTERSEGSSSLTSTSTTISYGARRYPEHQPGCRWVEYESPLNRPLARPHSDRLTPPPPYIPLQEPQLPPPLPSQPAVDLSEEQKRVLRLVQNGKNIFFTGPAGKLAWLLIFKISGQRTIFPGTGKSVLLRAIIELLRVRFRGGVAITAPTGIAGVNIGGSTIHSWAGIGLGKESVETLEGSLGSWARKRWQNTHALVIDEISMLDGRLFDKLVRFNACTTSLSY